MGVEMLSFENATARIEEIVKLLENGDEPLDKSLELFEEGAKLIKQCGIILDQAEQKVKSLQVSASTGEVTIQEGDIALKESLFGAD